LSEYFKLDLSGWPKYYIEKNLKSEYRETYYSKGKDGLYYQNKSIITKTGSIIDQNKISKPFTETITSYWYDFKTTNVTPISFEEEVDNEKFKNATYHKVFWDNYNRPKPFLP